LLYNKLRQIANQEGGGGVLLGGNGVLLGGTLKSHLIKRIGDIYSISDVEAKKWVDKFLPLHQNKDANYLSIFKNSNKPDSQERKAYLAVQSYLKYKKESSKSYKKGKLEDKTLTLNDFINPEPSLYASEFIQDIIDPTQVDSDPAKELKRRQDIYRSYLKATGSKPNYDFVRHNEILSEFEILVADYDLQKAIVDRKKSDLLRIRDKIRNDRDTYKEWINSDPARKTFYDDVVTSVDDRAKLREKIEKDRIRAKEVKDISGLGYSSDEEEDMSGSGRNMYAAEVGKYIKKHKVTLAVASKAVSKKWKAKAKAKKAKSKPNKTKAMKVKVMKDKVRKLEKAIKKAKV
jgi:hypothetical protein